ncbi:tetratricopeptide repeat protein [Candidatus Daviesbacteria bacterium]|nr:tetratricopeptide repeat protein [Candidatus Daviesbacteria bacterium]
MTKKDKVKKLLIDAEKCLILGENSDAETISRQIIELAPNNSAAYYFLGEALCKQEKFQESMDILRKADKLLPNHPRITHLLGWAIFMNGDVELGRTLIKRALTKLPEDIQILCDLAVLETRQGNGDLAKEYALKAFEIDATHPLVQEVFKTVVHFDKERSRLTKWIN